MNARTSLIVRCFVFSVFCLTLMLSTFSETAPSLSARLSVSFVIVRSDGSNIQANFESLQQAINEAEENSTIFVPASTYFEHVVVNKTLTLVGEANLESVIDGSGNGTVLEITANNVIIKGFKVQNSGYGWNNNGIYAHNADDLTIQGNHMHDVCHNIKIGFSNNTYIQNNVVDGTMIAPTMYGIRVENSTNCTVRGNNVSDCVGAIHLQNASECTIVENRLQNNSQGIRFYSPCTFNEAYKNNIANCTYDGAFVIMPNNTITFLENRFFHNNFMNNTYGFIDGVSGNHWDDGYPSGGNYWSRFNGTDLFTGTQQNETGKDGIGDVPYMVNSYESDRYPLISPYRPVRNLNTGVSYFAIQSAINDPETVDSHDIFVDTGVYYENVVINKSIALLGRSSNETIIDADGVSTAVTVNVDGVTLLGFTIRRSGPLFPPYGSDCGLLLDRCSYCTIRDNQITENRIGVYLFFSARNVLEENIVRFNSANGICLWYSGGNNLSRNRMFDNKYNFGAFGDTCTDLDNNIDASNTADGKPITYLINKENEFLDGESVGSTIYLVNCANITVADLKFSANSHGVFFHNVTSSTIINITAWGSEYGVCLQESYNNKVYYANCTNNWVGLLLQKSQGNTLRDNLAIGGEKGISLYEAHDNLIEGNTVKEAYFGIRVYASNNNSFVHNNFIDNVEQANVIHPSYQNVWNSSLEGNFWNDYSGNDANYDGIGENQYVINAENKDGHPLLGAFHGYQFASEANSSEFCVITNSTLMDCQYEPSNKVIRLTVNGNLNTQGFCRLAIPYALVHPDIQVIIDDGSTPIIIENLNLRDDGSCRWVYFSYQHSAHDVTVLPESSLHVLLLYTSVVSVFLAVVFNGTWFGKRSNAIDSVMVLAA